MNTPLQLFQDTIPTPIGELMILVDTDGALRVAGFVDGDRSMARQLRSMDDPERFATTQKSNPHGISTVIRSYFGGDLRALDDLPVIFTDGTPFQRSVWKALREIPCGQTWSYGDMAKRIGSPDAVRAVGLANGANPVGLIVPCHRVIGSNGSLTGYGGGIERKRWLLAHERPAGKQTQLAFA